MIDESDWNERETEDANETWTQCFNDAQRLAWIRDRRAQFDFHNYRDLMGCVRGRYFAGYASDLLA